jgi:hypothetical protein
MPAAQRTDPDPAVPLVGVHAALPASLDTERLVYLLAIENLIGTSFRLIVPAGAGRIAAAARGLEGLGLPRVLLIAPSGLSELAPALSLLLVDTRAPTPTWAGGCPVVRTDLPAWPRSPERPLLREAAAGLRAAITSLTAETPHHA